MSSKTSAITYLFICLIIVSLNYCNCEDNISVGERENGDVQIAQVFLSKRSTKQADGHLFKTLIGKDSQIITRIDIENVGVVEGSAALIHGGPGHKFATVVVSASTQPLPVEYKVTLYGKSKL